MDCRCCGREPWSLREVREKERERERRARDSRKKTLPQSHSKGKREGLIFVFLQPAVLKD